MYRTYTHAPCEQCTAQAGPHLRAVVHDCAAAQVPAQHTQVLEVVALNHHAAVTVDAVPDEGAVGVQDVEQLLSINLRKQHTSQKSGQCMHGRLQSRDATCTGRGVEARQGAKSLWQAAILFQVHAQLSAMAAGITGQPPSCRCPKAMLQRRGVVSLSAAHRHVGASGHASTCQHHT